jgi:hypothetical protein
VLRNPFGVLECDGYVYLITTSERVLHCITDDFQNRHPIRENWTVDEVVAPRTGGLAIDLHAEACAFTLKKSKGSAIQAALNSSSGCARLNLDL